MKFSFKSLAVLALAPMLMAGCMSSIETGEVGVRTTFTGKVLMAEEGQGFHTHWTSSLDRYSIKQITVSLDDLQPKAADNLTLDDLDIEVYYTINPDRVAEISVKYQNRHARGPGVLYPAYYLVESEANSAIQRAVAKFDSLTVHQERAKLREIIREQTQQALDQSDPGDFQVRKVVIRDVKTDPSIEESIKLAVAREKELEAKRVELEIAEEQVLINESLTKSLTPEILEQRRLEVIENACKVGTCILSLEPGAGATPVLSIR